MDRKVLTQLKRSELQSLAKNNNIRATQSSAALIDELAALPHPNIGGVPALKQKMGKDALMRQKIMQRNGYAQPKAAPAGREKAKPKGRQELPAKERAAAKRKPAGSGAKRGARAGTATDCAPEASSSKASGSQHEDADVGQADTSGPVHEDDGVMDPTAQKQSGLAPAHGVLSPALRRGNVVPGAGAPANDVSKDRGVADATSTSQQLGLLAEDDEDFRDEEEVEAMTSLENIVVDLSSPARPEACKGKRKAECDFVESPRPAKRTRSLRVA